MSFVGPSAFQVSYLAALRQRGSANYRRYGSLGRHRRSAQRRQVHALQRALVQAGRGCQLRVLHHRAQRRRGAGAGPALRRAVSGGRARRTAVPATVDFVDIAGLVRGASQGRGQGQRVPDATSASATPSPTWCAASRTTTSCTSTTGSTRPPTSRPSTPSSSSRTSTAVQKRARPGAPRGQGQRRLREDGRRPVRAAREAARRAASAPRAVARQRGRGQGPARARA